VDVGRIFRKLENAVRSIPRNSEISVLACPPGLGDLASLFYLVKRVVGVFFSCLSPILTFILDNVMPPDRFPLNRRDSPGKTARTGDFDREGGAACVC
jgi:hypothetical protein